MDKALFWKLIDDTRREVSPSDEIAAPLADKLASMEVGEIMRWLQIFDAYQQLSYKNKLWAAAYVINGGCSDDGFDYFRGWLTSQGKETFLQALADPDSLVDVDVEMDEAFYEEMLNIGYSAYFKKMGMSQPDYAKALAAYKEHALSDSERQELAADIHYATDMDVQWEEDALATVVPKLCARFN